MTATDEPLVRELTKRAENALRPRLVKLLGAAHSNHRDVAGLAEVVIDMIRSGWSIDGMIGQLKPIEEGLRNYPFYITQPIEEVVLSVAETLDFVTLQHTMLDFIGDENDPTSLTDQYVSMGETVGRIEHIHGDGTYLVDLFALGKRDKVSRSEITFGLGYDLDKARSSVEVVAQASPLSEFEKAARGLPHDYVRAFGRVVNGFWTFYPPYGSSPQQEQRKRPAQPQARREKRQKVASSAREQSPKGIVDFDASFEPMEPTEPMQPIDPSDPLWFFKGCGPSDKVNAVAEALSQSNQSKLCPVMQTAQKILLLANNRQIQSPQSFVKQANFLRMELLRKLEAASGSSGKNWQGRGNVGDTISLRTLVAIVKHWAPPSSLDRKHLDSLIVTNPGSKIPRTNPCISPWINSIARSLHKESDGIWDPSVHPRFISERLVFIDAYPIVPISKDNHMQDFRDFAGDAGITMDQLHLIGFLLYVLHARAHALHREKPLTVAVATRAGWSDLFHPHAPSRASEADVLGMVAHGQCWAMRLPLMNYCSHPDDFIVEYSRILLHLYSVIAQAEGSSFMPNPPAVSFVAQRFGARMGADLSPEEREARIRDIMATLAKAQANGRATQDAAWLAWRNKSMNEEQETYVLRMLEVLERGRETTAFAWLAYLSGEATPRQRSIVERMRAGRERGCEKMEKARAAVRSNGGSSEQQSMVERWQAGVTKHVAAQQSVWDRKWLAKFDELKQYKEDHGHTRVLRTDVDNKSLAAWINTQRQQVKTLSPWQKKLLNEIGFDWNPPRGAQIDNERKWMDKFRELEQFKAEHGHTRVPQEYARNRPLGKWVHKQRTNQRGGTLKPRRKVLLVEIGFSWKGR